RVDTKSLREYPSRPLLHSHRPSKLGAGMQRILGLTGCLLCLACLGGCLYCAYPRIDYTPEVNLDAPASGVHVFRVDSTTEGVFPFSGFIHVPEDQLHRWNKTSSSSMLSEVCATPTETVPAQIKSSLSYGFVIPILVVNALLHTSHSMSLRLYRPGYELIEIKSWERPGQIVWKRAPDLESQEKVLDALMDGQLTVGAGSPAHLNALLFVAAEFERLAAATSSKQQKARLLARAKYFRDGAAAN